MLKKSLAQDEAYTDAVLLALLSLRKLDPTRSPVSILLSFLCSQRIPCNFL